MRRLATSHVTMATADIAMGIATGSRKVGVRLLVGLVILLPACAATAAFGEPLQDTLADPKYVEFVSLRETPDTTHRVAVKDADGKTWYREETAGLDLRHVRLAETYVMHSLDGESFTVMLWVDHSHGKRLLEWSQKRIGKPAGIMVGGKLCFADTLHYPLDDVIGLSPFKTLDEALKVCAAIRLGGDVAKLEGEFKQLKREYERWQAELAVLREQRAREEPPPDAFEIVSLRERPDAKHTVPVHGPDQKWWYRDPVAGLDLSHCETFELGGAENASYGFRSVVKDAHVARFSKWCRERVGQHFGLMSDGYLTFVDRMPGELVDKLNRLTLVVEPMEPMPIAEPASAPADAKDVDKPRIEITVEEEFVKASVLHCKYLEVVSLSDSPDDTHTKSIKGPQGKQWYREESAGLDLCQCSISQTAVGSSFDGAYRLYVLIDQAHQGNFSAWCRQRNGGYVGVILDGALVRVERIQTEPVGMLEIATFSTKEAAVKQRDLIRRGGNP